MNKFSILLLLLIGCGRPITYESEFHPLYRPQLKGISEELILEGQMSLNFDLLPLKGEADAKNKLWSGDSWRLGRGAINFRWNSPSKEGFDYQSPTMRDFFSMPQEKMATLSPAEKYDLFMGRYDYPLKSEVDQLARTGMESWEGLCHGWAGASLNHPEPSPKVMKNPDGIEVPFGASDIKALLTYAYSKVRINDTESIGKRCDENLDSIEDTCDDDLSPISFHAVLTNKLGIRGESFIADVDRFKEVWNHPVVSYNSHTISDHTIPTGREVTVITKIAYTDVTESNSWETQSKLLSYMTMEYDLTLDKSGNMVSGKWRSRERPDFLWTVKEQLQFEGYLSGVKTLIK